MQSHNNFLYNNNLLISKKVYFQRRDCYYSFPLRNRYETTIKFRRPGMDPFRSQSRRLKGNALGVRMKSNQTLSLRLLVPVTNYHYYEYC